MATQPNERAGRWSPQTPRIPRGRPAGRPVRYAVVGLGNIAQVAVLPSFEHVRENSELCALVSSDETKRSELGKQYRVQHGGSYDDLEDVLEKSGADAVYLAVPNHLHRDFTLRAAKAGVHVLCEKPMAMSVDDCRTMIAACDEANTLLMLAYRLHFEQATLRALDIVRSGLIGDVVFFSSVFGQQVRGGDIRTRADVGGGALFDMGIYCVNAARHVFDEEPLEVFAFMSGGDDRFHDVDATTATLLRFSGDRIAQLTSSQSSADVESYRIVGTKGDLRVEPAFTFSGDIVHHLTVNGKKQTTIFTARDQFGPELYTFSKCIIEGTIPEASGEEGLADVRILEAAVDSARRRVPISLTPFARKQRPEMSQEVSMPPVAKRQPVNAPSPTR